MENSVTIWLNQLRMGNELAATKLWNQFFERMRAVAADRLRLRPGFASLDEEGAALSAFDVFIRSLQDGEFSELNNRDELWRLLVTITLRKANRQLEKEGTQKRGGVFAIHSIEDYGEIKAESTLVMATDECEHLLNILGDEELQQVAIWKLEGYTNDEIAHQLGSTKRTVQRMTAGIRSIWQADASRDC